MARENKRFVGNPYEEDKTEEKVTPLHEAPKTETPSQEMAQEGDILAKYAKKPKRVQSGVYLDADIRKVADSLKKQYGKGVISDMINDLLRKEFQKQGLLK